MERKQTDFAQVYDKFYEQKRCQQYTASKKVFCGLTDTTVIDGMYLCSTHAGFKHRYRKCAVPDCTRPTTTMYCQSTNKLHAAHRQNLSTANSSRSLKRTRTRLQLPSTPAHQQSQPTADSSRPLKRIRRRL